MDAWNVALYERLTHSSDSQLAAIAAKAIKEARYHLRFSRGWLVRLGDGTETSSQRMQQAVDTLWRFTAELFEADDVELALIASGVAVDPRELRQPWEQEVFSGLQEATLSVPSEVAYRTGGKRGLHTEHLGPMLAEMQYLQRAIRVSSGKYGGEDAAFCRDCTRGDPSNLVVVKPDPGPEVPVLTITDLGMVRSVSAQGEGWIIGFTPTYSGCPATEHLLGAIREAMTAHALRQCILCCSSNRPGPPTG